MSTYTGKPQANGQDDCRCRAACGSAHDSHYPLTAAGRGAGGTLTAAASATTGGSTAAG